jgi:hypothetical protein
MAKKKAQSTKTKAELLEELSRLKKLLVAAREEIESLKEKKVSTMDKLKAKFGSLPEEAIGMIKVGNKYKKVSVAFNPKSGESKIKSITNFDRLEEDAAMALFNMKKYIIDNIYTKCVDSKGEDYESVEDFKN